MSKHEPLYEVRLTDKEIDILLEGISGMQKIVESVEGKKARKRVGELNIICNKLDDAEVPERPDADE